MCECTIGLLHYCEHDELVTLSMLEADIADRIEHNEYLNSDPVFRGCKELRMRVWRLEEYADRRKTTDLTRFEYCPFCGDKIDWLSIRKKSRQQ